MSINYAAHDYVPAAFESLRTLSTDLSLADSPLMLPVEVVEIETHSHDMAPLLERGIVLGSHLVPIRLSPSGDPIVRVDGGLVALRREVARSLIVRPVQRRS